jgi:membrane protein
MAEKKSWWKKFQALLDERGLRSEADLTRLTKFIHFWVLLWRSFVRNRCPIRASALSYTTLLALIPLLAVAISITSSLLKDQGEDGIYNLVDKMVDYMMPATITTNTAAAITVATGANPASLLALTNSPAGTNESLAPVATNSIPVNNGADRVETAQREITKKIHEFITNTRSGVLGATGMIILVIVGIRVLGSIESTFNDIWGVTRGRNWFSRIQIYCTAILLGPLLLTGAAALANGRHWQSTRELFLHMPLVGSFIFPVLTLVVLWFLFALFYQLVPNTKVQFGAAIIGGIVAGSLWHLNNVFGFIYASRMATNANIYGKLAAVPVFMMGLYFSWLILLFGAQVAYAFQNRTLYLQEKIAENVNQRGREFVALRLMTCIGQRFQRGLPPATIQEMSRELAIPSRLVQQVLQTLMAAQLVAEITGAESGYTPARPLENINAHHLLQAMRATTGQELVTRDEPIREEVYGEFARIQEAEKQAAASVSMLALVSRAQARLEVVESKKLDAGHLKSETLPILTSGELADEKNKFLPSFILQAPEVSPEEIVRQEDQDSLAVPETASPTKPEPETKPETLHLSVATPADEEREFPL